ncbi:MAG: cupin domain-containing protein, partial [Sciscionella sp.]
SGTGVWTTVNGDACDMSPGDLILTPSWNWHDHTSTSDGSMFWFDGLDLPMVEALDAIFFEPYPELSQPGDERRNRSEGTYRATGKQFVDGAVTDRLDPQSSPLLVYRWADTDAELTRIAERSDEPMASLEFVNPETGASALPTLSCGMLRLAPGRRTAPVRRTGNTVFVVYRGHGTSVVAGQRMAWSDGDMFVVPSWSAVEHMAGEGADLFALGDAPVLRALGIYREEQLSAPQPVLSAFGSA